MSLETLSVRPRLRCAMLAAFGLALLAGPAEAQTAPPAETVQEPAQAQTAEPASEFPGAFEISNADRDHSCILNLAGDKNARRGRVEQPPLCADELPFTRAIVGWSLGQNDEVRLLDGQGRLVILFNEVEAGIYEGDRDGLYFLQNAAAAVASEISPRDVVGDWTVVTGTPQKGVCHMNFAPAPDGQVLNPIRVAPGCDAAVARFSASSWRIERSQLVVSSTRGQTWRFDRESETVWRRVPESVQPLALMRGEP